MFENSSILITGGTGSFGEHFVSYLLKNYNPKKILVFSRDEQKHFNLSRKFKKFNQRTPRRDRIFVI